MSLFSVITFLLTFETFFPPLQRYYLHQGGGVFTSICFVCQPAGLQEKRITRVIFMKLGEGVEHVPRETQSV